MTRERKRRQYGTGSVYQRASDGRWLGTIEAGFTRTGSRRRITVTGKTEAQAKERLKKKLRELARGESAGSTRATVRSWSETWLAEQQRRLAPNNYATERGAVSRWVIPTIGHKRLEQLTPADVRAVRNAVLAAGLSTTTAGRYHGVLIRMLKAAAAEGHPVASRVLEVEGPALAVNDREALTLNEALAVLAVASELPHASRWVAAFLQGMRQAECLGLTWDEVHEDRLSVSWQLQPLPYNVPRNRSSGFRVPDGYESRQLHGRLHLVRPKSKAGWRTIPLVPTMAAALEKWREIAPASPHGLVWPALSGQPADDVEDRTEWYALQDTADVHHPSGRFYHLHEARHTAATLLMELGVPEAVRIAVLGHSSIAVTRGYEHVDLTLAREALGRMASRLELG